MKLNHFKLILFSGAIWFCIGMYLLTIGMRFIVHVSQFGTEGFSLISRFTPIAGSREQAALLLIVLGLLIGFMKGRFVLSKTVQRVVQRIISLPLPIKFSQVYGPGYLALIAGMILLGMSLKWLHFPIEFRGIIDVAIGSALLNGATAYFRTAIIYRRSCENHQK